MKKRIYTFGLTIFLFLITLNISLRYCVSYSICNEEVGHTFAIRINDVIDTIYDDSDINTLIDVQKSVGKEKAIRNIVTRYIDLTLSSVIKNESLTFDHEEKDVSSITKETLELITKKLDDTWKKGPEFEEDVYDEVKNGLYTLQAYALGIQNTLANHKVITFFYYALTSEISFIFFFVSTLLFFALSLSQLSKFDFIHCCISSLFASTILLFLSGFSFYKIAWKLSNRLLGRAISFITYPFYGVALVMITIMIVIIVFQKRDNRV